MRSTTICVTSIVASAFGMPPLFPYKVICRSKKLSRARRSGIRIVQQITIMMGCAVHLHMRNLVLGLSDEKQKVGLAALFLRHRVV